MIGGMLPGQLFCPHSGDAGFPPVHRRQERLETSALVCAVCRYLLYFRLVGLVLMQSHYITNKERGFDYHRVAYASGVSFDSDAESDANRSVMLSLPYVEDGGL